MNPLRLRLRMRELNLSNAKLAELSGISESTIKRALVGARLNESSVAMLAHALNVDVDWLNDPSSPPNEPVVSQFEQDFDPNDPNELIEPDEPEDADAMIESLRCVIESYKERIIEQRENHKAEIERMTRNHESRVNALTKDKIALAIAAGALMLFIVALFSYDILNPTVGWFQR